MDHGWLTNFHKVRYVCRLGIEASGRQLFEPGRFGLFAIAVVQGTGQDSDFPCIGNALLNLPGLSDGSITVIDLVKGEVIGSVNALKDQGFNPNSIVLLPQWNHPAGH